MTIEDLITRYPLRVRQPGLTGPVHILVWWTHDEQYHCIVGRNEAAVVRTYNAVLSQTKDDNRRWSWSEAEPREYYVGEVRAPSRRWQEEHALRAYENHKDGVIRWVTSRIEEAEKTEIPLPSGIQECTTYHPDPEYFGDDEPDDYYKETHYKCLDCFDQYKFALSRDALYERFEEHYKVENDWDYKPPSKDDGAVSRAPLMDESKPLYAITGGGLHSGISVNVHVVEENGYGIGGAIFCFQGEKLEVPEAIRQRRQALDAQKQLIVKVQKQKQHKVVKKKRDERREWLEAFLTYLE